MTGYQEILTDPSLQGPNRHDDLSRSSATTASTPRTSSRKPACGGLHRPRTHPVASNFRSAIVRWTSILADHSVLGIDGIDTRALRGTSAIRGAMNGVLSTDDLDDATLWWTKARRSARPGRARPGEGGQCRDVISLGRSDCARERVGGESTQPMRGRYARRRLRLRHEVEHPALPASTGCEVTVRARRHAGRGSPALKPDGVFLSNGPGDPGRVTYAIEPSAS